MHVHVNLSSKSSNRPAQSYCGGLPHCLLTLFSTRLCSNTQQVWWVIRRFVLKYWSCVFVEYREYWLTFAKFTCKTRLSCLSRAVVLCLNKRTYIHTLSAPGRAIIVVFPVPNRCYKILMLRPCTVNKKLGVCRDSKYVIILHPPLTGHVVPSTHIAIFTIFDWNRRLSRKRYEIGSWLLWNVNSKS